MFAPASILVAVLVLIIGTATAAEPPAKPPTPDPITSYEARWRRGFKVMINKRLPDGGPAVRCLDERLAEIVRVVPAAHLSVLRGVTFWVEAGPVSEPVLTLKPEGTAAGYIPLDGDYRAYGIRREKQGGVLIVATIGLVEPSAGRIREVSPGWLLHEVAHALQDRLARRDHPLAEAVYRQAMDRKLYDGVDARVYREDGRPGTKRGPAYARTNPKEYFAELSAAYLGLPTHALPFTRDQLQEHDVAGYELMETFWRSARCTAVNGLPVPVSVDRVAENGRRFRLFDLWPGKEKVFDGWQGMGLIATDLLDGTEYPVGKSGRDGRSWRVTPRLIGSGARAVTPPAPPASR